MTLFGWQRGTEIEFHYPMDRHVLRFDPTQSQVRQVVINSIRDLVADPLTPEEFLRRPFLRRSRWLIRAWEPSLRQYRQFYIGSAREFRAPQQLRLALYEPEGQRPAKLLIRSINPAMRDCRTLARLLHRWRDRDFGGLQMRIYADDMRRAG